MRRRLTNKNTRLIKRRTFKICADVGDFNKKMEIIFEGERETDNYRYMLLFF